MSYAASLLGALSVNLLLKGNGYTFKGGNSFKTVLSPSWKGVYSKRKEFDCIGGKFFPFRVDAFSKGTCCTGKQLGSHKSCLPWGNGGKPTKHINIGIKHGFSCINICQVPWEVLKTEAEGRGIQHLPRDQANVNALKNPVRSLLLHKNWKQLLHFALFFALFCFAFSPMSCERNFHWLCSS